MMTAKQQKLKDELKKKHQNKNKNKNKSQQKNTKPAPKSNPKPKVDICEVDCICDEIKEKNNQKTKAVPKAPFTFSKNPIANAMLLGDILGTPAFRKNYRR